LRPSTSTLFPYTTLFRSALHAAAFVVNSDHDAGTRLVNGGRQRRQLCAVTIVACEQDHAARQRIADAANIVLVEFGTDHIEHHGDRKSTRLNSSHVKISY